MRKRMTVALVLTAIGGVALAVMAVHGVSPTIINSLIILYSMIALVVSLQVEEG